MEKHKHPLDEFFREELKNFAPEPSAAAKEAFGKSTGELLRTESSRKRWFLLPVLLLLVAGSVTAVYVITAKHQVTVESPAINQVVSPAGTAAPLSETVSPPPAETVPQQTVKIKRTNTASSSSSLSVPSASVTTATTGDVQTYASPAKENEPVVQETPATGVTSTGISDKTFEETASVISPVPLPLPDSSLATDSTTLDSLVTAKKKRKPQVARKDLSLLVGVQYTPEWMFNTLEGDKYVNNFGLEGTFRFGRYSIRTGVGLSLTKGTNELAIGYNDYLGAYQDLDSIQFTWDEQHIQLLPTIYTTEQHVWDSLVRIEENKVIKRYTYLQIPLVLGYDVLEKGRFAMGFRIGPVLSLLLASKQLSANYDPGQDKIVTINEITPDRIQTNWQVMAGINFAFLLNKRWTIELEPEGRYYFNSVYEKSDITKKPWSVGIRAAVLFDLKK